LPGRPFAADDKKEWYSIKVTFIQINEHTLRGRLCPPRYIFNNTRLTAPVPSPSINVKLNFTTMKKTTVFCINVLVGSLLIFLASYIQVQETQVKVTGIRSPKGKIILTVFKDNKSYDNEQPFKTLTFDKKAINNGTLTVMVELEPGTYGITLIDDENDNGKIDKNLIRMPKEGFGFSNFFMEKLKKPTFDDFKVDLKSPAKVDIRVKYM
jgi:uncharacterized protein (DUF2141 family)